MTKTTLTRKEREYMEREQLILDTARDVLASDGFHALSMERIASEIEYSKGTIYNHFKSKEDILTTMCCESMQSLTELFDRAVDLEGSSREKISAIILAYALHALLRPVDIQNMQSIKTQVMRDKVTPELLAEMNTSEQNICISAHKIIIEAVEKGDLSIDEDTAGEMITGVWAMGYGTVLLQETDVNFNQMGIALPEKQFLHNAQRLLDGYNWLPLSNSFDVEKYYFEIGKKVFPDEMKALKLI